MRWTGSRGCRTWRSQENLERQVFPESLPLDIPPLFLSVLISFHKQILPSRADPGRGVGGWVALVTLPPGLGKLSKGRPGCAHLHYLGFKGQEPRRAVRWVRPAPRGPRAPRPRALAVECPCSRTVPVRVRVRSQARGGRVRAPGSCAARSPFQSDGRVGPGSARPFELAGVGAAEISPRRARDPAPSGRRARAAVGGTGRSAGPPSAGSPGRKGHCPEPLRPRAGLCEGRQRQL